MFLKLIDFASNSLIPAGSSDILLSDFLADNTLKIRRWLLVLTVVSLYISTAKMVPTKISALGIEFSALNQQQFLKISSYVLMYFLISFTIYACIDFLKRMNDLLEIRKKYFTEIKVSVPTKMADSDFDENMQYRADSIQTRFIDPIETAQFLSSPVILVLSITRVSFDILLPIIVGIYSFILLW